MKIQFNRFFLFTFVISLSFSFYGSAILLQENILTSQELEAPIINPEIISKINSMNTTWTAGVNKRFIGQSLKQAKNLLGLLPNPKERKLLFKQITVRKDLPENFDLREQYPNCESLRDIRDQSTCSSCWAFGAAEAMSDRICILSDQKITDVRISAEDVLACCTECGVGCRGGYPFEAWDYFKNHGVVTGGNYQEKGTCKPYSFRPCDHGDAKGSHGPCDFDVETPICKQECETGYQRNYNEDKWYGADSYSLYGGEEQMMTEIYEKGSIEVGYSVYEDFFSYTSGVYKHETGSYMGGHAVKCIGWGVENGTKYWLIANSWNTEWGEKGFFKILRGIDHVGIESSVDTGTPNLKNMESRYRKDKEFLKYLIE